MTTKTSTKLKTYFLIFNLVVSIIALSGLVGAQDGCSSGGYGNAPAPSGAGF